MNLSAKTLILATDKHRSVLAESTPGAISRIAYSPYGSLTANQLPQARLGFNGEFRERPQGWYHLGNGHRIYNPVLMRFHSPDRLSPFAEGGLNPYAYCLGDPLNYSDPTGKAPSWVHGLSFTLMALTLISGAASLLAPLMVSKYTGVAALIKGTTKLYQTVGAVKQPSMIASYVARFPSITGQVSGGIDAGTTMLGLVGVPIGAYGTVMDMQDSPSRAAMSAMYLGSGIAVLGGVLKAGLAFTPAVFKSKYSFGISRVVHGKEKALAASAKNYAPIKALQDAQRKQGILPTPALPSPLRAIPKPPPLKRNGLGRAAARHIRGIQETTV